MHDYNTTRPNMILREYGRNVHRLVEHLKQVEDKEKRTELAYSLVELMRQLNPSTKDYQDNQQKLWDDLYIISGFDLDVDGPFPAPEPTILERKPEKVHYKDGEITFRHYGRHIELLVERAKTIEDPREREAAILLIGKLMKTFAGGSSNRDSSSDDTVILESIKRLSKGELKLEIDPENENTVFDIIPQSSSKVSNRQNNNNKKGKKRRK